MRPTMFIVFVLQKEFCFRSEFILQLLLFINIWNLEIQTLSGKIYWNCYSKHFSINNNSLHSIQCLFSTTIPRPAAKFHPFPLHFTKFDFHKTTNDFCVGLLAIYKKRMWQRSSYCKLESTYYRQTKFVINFTRLNLALFFAAAFFFFLLVEAIIRRRYIVRYIYIHSFLILYAHNVLTTSTSSLLQLPS